MLHRPRGAQWASHPRHRWRIEPAQPAPEPSVARGAHVARTAFSALFALLIALGALPMTSELPAVAAGRTPKVVVIVGPASSSTSEYLRDGERIARQAEAQGMDVRRIFTPHATWDRVKPALQGANLVVYLGHGNGWPSAMGPFQGDTKDGLGLNSCDGCGLTSPVTYYGEDHLRSEVQLAKNAVVLLRGLCYASGNAEDGMAPVFDRVLATQRASNFAAGFLDAGARAVFALGWQQNLDLPAQLADTNRTMDEIFETPASDWTGAYDGFIGSGDYYRDSTRTGWARVHLDPHPRYGHLRALTGDLRLTAAEWRGETPKPDKIAPTLKLRPGHATDDASVAALTTGVATFSPNGDHHADLLVVAGTLSERARIDMEIRDAKGKVVRHTRGWRDKGAATATWGGRNQQGNLVHDGIYTVRLTPRDRAGNTGRTRVVKVRVLGFATLPKLDRDALNLGDGDKLASGTRLRTTLSAKAKVKWEIKRGGKVVRTLYAGTARPGTLSVRWDGRDGDGKLVKDGKYTAVLQAKTKSGKLRLASIIRVGAYQLRVDPKTPTRGRTTTFHVTSAEPQAKAPVVEVRQPGADPVRIKTKAVDAQHAWGKLTLRKNAKKGTFTIRVLGTDAGGRAEERTFTRTAR